MARNWFKPGSWNINCMVCDRKVKANEIQKRWDGLWVCKEDYENRHPQDFLRAIPEKMQVPFVFHSSTEGSSQTPVYPIGPSTLVLADGSTGLNLSGQPTVGIQLAYQIQQGADS